MPHGRDRPTDPFERLGLQAGSRESMAKIGSRAEAFDKWRGGIRDPHIARLAREISETHYRQINILAYISTAFAEPAREVVAKKKSAPIGLWGHIVLWWRER